MPKRQLAIAFAALLCWALPLTGQQPAEMPLTNADVANMLRAGLPESTIVHAIQLASRRGTADFDTSPRALVELREVGATEDILNAMLGARPRPVVPGLPEESGVYYQTPTGWVALRSFLLWPPFFGQRFERRAEFSLAIPGQRAEAEIAETSPAFHVRGLQPGADWHLVRLEVRRDRREFRVTRYDLPSPAVMFTPEEVRPIEQAAVGGDVFTIRPQAPLESGEYALCTVVPLSRQLLSCYPFAIRP